MKTTKKAFWFHYNKPESKKAGEPRITLHYKNTCHIVHNVVSLVQLEGRLRKTQPRWVMTGKAENIEIKNNVAHIS